MLKEKLLVSSTFLILFIVALNIRFFHIPPIGKLINPFSGFIQNSYENEMEGEINLNGIDSTILVLFDDRAVPHVFSKNKKDLYFTQGYLHARDRLWQMDFISRVSSGRLSEIIGNQTLEADKLTRRKGLLWSAENSIKYIKATFPQTYKELEFYSQGVNEYINHLNIKDYPIEFKIFNYTPEEWTPLKSILIMKYMGNLLSGYDEDAEMTNALNYFKESNFNYLYKSSLKNKSTMIEFYNDIKDTVDDKKIYANNKMSKLENKFHKDFNCPLPQYGSNSWVISKEKSASGSPILCNDPHLPLSLPSTWYEMQLSYAANSVYGVSIPGVPYIIIGYNDNIAWGITSGATDVKDWYSIKLKNNNSEYYFSGKWQKTKLRIEKINIYGGRSVIDSVAYTDFGPVVYDKNFMSEKGKENLVLKWVLHNNSNDLLTFSKLNHGRDINDYKEAVKYLSCPNLNISFASKEDIAICHQGAIPLRKKEEGKFIFNADTLNAINNTLIPNENLPYEINPKKGYVFSTNQNPISTNYPFSFIGHYEEHRNRQLENNLSKQLKFNIDDMKLLQQDNFDLFASEAIPIMIKNIDKKQLNKEELMFLDTLINWNFKLTSSSIAPTLSTFWRESFKNLVWDELSSNEIKYPSETETLNLLKNDIKNKYFDRISTPEIEKGNDIIQSSFKRTIKRYNIVKKENNITMTWGNVKRTTFYHAGEINTFNSDIVQCDGGEGTINATSGDWGPNWRMIVDFKDAHPKGWGINPGGQSGNPGSLFYGYGINDWSKGKYYEFTFISDLKKTKRNFQTLVIH